MQPGELSSNKRCIPFEAERVLRVPRTLFDYEEARLLRSTESRERANEALHVANLTKSQKAADYEEVLDQLKLAAGAASLEEVVEELFAQSTTTTSLGKEKAQAEARLVAVRQEKEQALQALNELKASGIGDIELNREVYNTLESEALDLTDATERTPDEPQRQGRQVLRLCDAAGFQ